MLLSPLLLFLWNLNLSKFSVFKASTEIHFPSSLMHSWVRSVNTAETSPLTKLYFQRLFQCSTVLRKSLQIPSEDKIKNYLASGSNSTQNVKERETQPKSLNESCLLEASKVHPATSENIISGSKYRPYTRSTQTRKTIWISFFLTTSLRLPQKSS